MSELLPFAAVIPAAGNSGRMGTDKALLKFPGGKTFTEHLNERYTHFGAKPVVIVINNTLDLSGVNLGYSLTVMNDHVEYGRSYSVKLGLHLVPEECVCFIQNVDNPFVDHDLLHTLLKEVKDDSCVIPVYQGKGGHPVLLGKKVIATITNGEPFMDFRDVLKKFSRIEIPWKDPAILLNINTPEDYLKFAEMP